MKVRCGRCREIFEVSGPGRYPCPSCGVANEIPAAGGGQASAVEDDGTAVSAPSRLKCPDCGFSFIVGAVDDAPCPNCGTSVTVSSVRGDA